MEYILIALAALVIYTGIVLVFTVFGMASIILLSTICSLSTINTCLKYYTKIFHLLTFNCFKDGK
jgi:hypothetical protein